MKNSLILFFLFIGLQGIYGRVGAAETNDFYAKTSVEGGGDQLAGRGLSAYQYSRLYLESQQDILEGFSLGLAGEADWQSSGAMMIPSWPLYPTSNAVKLETDNIPSAEGNDSYSLRLDRAYLRLTSGPLDLTAGLFKPEGGSSFFYRPT